jgi:hypothetical protein
MKLGDQQRPVGRNTVHSASKLTNLAAQLQWAQLSAYISTITAQYTVLSAHNRAQSIAQLMRCCVHCAIATRQSLLLPQHRQHRVTSVRATTTSQRQSQACSNCLIRTSAHGVSTTIRQMQDCQTVGRKRGSRHTANFSASQASLPRFQAAVLWLAAPLARQLTQQNSQATTWLPTSTRWHGATLTCSVSNSLTVHAACQAPCGGSQVSAAL